MRPFEFLSMVLIKTRKAFLARLGSEAGDALDALLEVSLSYEESHSSSLAGFATWFASEDTEIKRNMDRGRGEVRLMTVHGAKGLESSIVILPDTTSMPRSNATSALMFVEPKSGGAEAAFLAAVRIGAVPGPSRTGRTGTSKRNWRSSGACSMWR